MVNHICSYEEQLHIPPGGLGGWEEGEMFYVYFGGRGVRPTWKSLWLPPCNLKDQNL